MKQILLILLLIQVSKIATKSEHLLHYVSDDVPGGSYKYYSLMYDGLVKISLTSQTGDADLYVSQSTTKPTYEPEHYCLQSTTCGEDIIYIPQGFKRPVGIGVYGHPSHELSKYTLLVYRVVTLKDAEIDEQNLSSNFDTERESKKETSSIVATWLWSFLDLLFQAIFL